MSSRHMLAGLAAVVLVTSGCSAADPGSIPSDAASSSGASTPSAAAAVLVGPADFALAVADPTAFTLNVHTPDAGSIEGTDAAIPFDQLADQAGALPSDRSTPIAVYCRSGRMSALAVPQLLDLGYVNVIELSGGMDAWTASGRTLLPAAP